VHVYETTIAQLEDRVERDPLERETSRERAEAWNEQQVAQARLTNAQANLESARESRDASVTYHRYALAVKTILPKTAETIALLERWLIDAADLPEFVNPDPSPVQIEMRLDEEGEMTDEMRDAQRQLMQAELQRELRSRSVWWVLGTSLVFEAAVLALGVWRFRRRDF
jgi:D-serine dehydratase